jgi:hypothetical protein
MVMKRYELHGVKVYELNIREAIQDHDLCPGITSLHAGCFGVYPSVGSPAGPSLQGAR